ncbi:DUF4185 domain-containing protein [Actinomycetospora endophytica]|uniref:DUF4185 domain-containing protein n=1 Tax=Actinomycetospora endophytica TaxID=2291215 RepID=A0ABS8PF26_9PSEU|nr:DUF4185 domain-containing protein [Actinomycetospora endophytica]
MSVLQSEAGNPPPPLVAPPHPAPAPPVALRWVVDPSGTQQISDVVGPQAAGGDTLPRFGVAGADLGHMFNVGGRIAIVFGDTYGGPPSPGRFFQLPHPDWRSNVFGWIDPQASPRDGFSINQMVTDAPNHAKELLHSRKVNGDEWTVIPTYGIDVGSRIYLHYMSVATDFAHPGRWPLNYAGVAFSDDGGRTWARPQDAQWPADTRFGQVAYVRPGGADDPDAPDPPRAAGVPRLPTASLSTIYPKNPYATTFPDPRDNTVYVYGIPGGRYGDVSLAAVPQDKLLDRSAYRYWTGTEWSSDEQAATSVIKGPVGELSVRYNTYYKTWMMMYLVDSTGQIVLRTSPNPTGPWGDPQVVTTTRDHPLGYAPYLTPRWNDGPDIWFTLSTYRDYRVSLLHTQLRSRPATDPLPKDVQAAVPPARR